MSACSFLRALVVTNQQREPETKFPQEFLARLEAITAKRPKTVIDHILEHGHITTEELSNEYGYNHPPRAARDVRELGIPLETFWVTGSDGRKIGAYRFGKIDQIKSGKISGRKVLSKGFKEILVQLYESRCGVCFTNYEPRYLQIDHRVPYEVGGEPPGELDASSFMLLCASCNRAKSWSCEHCKNWTTDRFSEVCQTCYWASPENYAHIALRLIRRLDITWSENEVPHYDHLVQLSRHAQKNVPEFVKDILRDVLGEKSD